MSVAFSEGACAPRNIFSRLSSRFSLLVIALVAGALAVSGCTGPTGGTAPSPINPANRPTPVTGYFNGYLPASLLYAYDSNCSLYRSSAGSFSAMIAAARVDGVDLAPAQCYRDYAGQLFWRNWWCQHGNCANAAVPGYSNHGWAKAVDFSDQGGALTWTSAGYLWLVAHAGEWGWNHPGGVNEAWHWEWVGDGGTLHGYSVRPDLLTWAG